MADEIRAEMVANVWKVVKSVGDPVEEGDTLVILESMKMEIPVIAEIDGVVQQIAVNEGDVVQEGDLIAVVGGSSAKRGRPTSTRSRASPSRRTARTASSRASPVTTRFSPTWHPGPRQARCWWRRTSRPAGSSAP